MTNTYYINIFKEKPFKGEPQLAVSYEEAEAHLTYEDAVNNAAYYDSANNEYVFTLCFNEKEQWREVISSKVIEDTKEHLEAIA